MISLITNELLYLSACIRLISCPKFFRSWSCTMWKQLIRKIRAHPLMLFRKAMCRSNCKPSCFKFCDSGLDVEFFSKSQTKAACCTKGRSAVSNFSPFSKNWWYWDRKKLRKQRKARIYEGKQIIVLKYSIENVSSVCLLRPITK